MEIYRVDITGDCIPDKTAYCFGSKSRFASVLSQLYEKVQNSPSAHLVQNGRLMELEDHEVLDSIKTHCDDETIEKLLIFCYNDLEGRHEIVFSCYITNITKDFLF